MAVNRRIVTTPPPSPDHDPLRALLEAAPEAIALVVGVQILFENQKLGALLGRAQSAGRGNAEPLLRLLARANLVREADGVQRGRLELRDTQISRHFEVVVTAIGLAGRAASAIFFREAATTPHEAEQRAQADRLTSLGRLAAGIAHEINNPLAYVLGSLEFVERAFRQAQEPGGDPLRDRSIVDALANAREGAERVRLIVRDLMAFARPVSESK